MKKRVLSLALALLLALMLAVSAAAADVSVHVDGKPVQWTDAVPFIDVNSRTMVPLRAVAEALGLNVSWDDPRHEAAFTDGRSTIVFPIGSREARTDTGRVVLMDTEAVIVNDRTYAPIRYLAEFFGCKVEWDDGSKTVLITTALHPASFSDLPAPEEESLRMWLASASCAVGGTVTVYWSGVTEEMLAAGAWIGLARSGMTSDEYTDYRYLNGEAGTVTFTPESAGVYEVRFYRAGYTGDESLMKDMNLLVDVH